MTAVETGLRWETVCPLERLQPERGAAALVEGRQVAVFRLHDGSVYAIGNIDPFSGAAVLSRGIVGDKGGVPVVASPVYKQAFRLLDGHCPDDQDVAVTVYAVRIDDHRVQIGLP